ncbi:MAG: 4Fe-4S binding protein [Firmicutes bacterium]|nr:4Fe-4S binding protein [Bacillota bacterium]
MFLKFLQEKCIGCKLCHLACSAARLDLFSHKSSNVLVESLYRDNELEVLGSVCDRCNECLKACPIESISELNGFLSVDKKTCTSCEACVNACPKGIIFMWQDFPQICNMCSGHPECISVCPREAIAAEV